MPLSVFDGEDHIEVHEHYDPDGNLTGTTVVTKPGWSDENRAWALGLTLREANRCPGCGGDLHETTDPDYRWVPDTPITCLRCVGLSAASKATEKTDPHHRQILHTVRKVPRPKPKKRR